MEKAKNNKEMLEYLTKIIENINKDTKTYTNEVKEVLISLIDVILKNKIGKEKAKKLVKKINGGDEKMLAVVEMIQQENERIYRDGRKEGKIEGKTEGKIEEKFKIIKKMIKEKMPISLIAKVTEMPEEEIKKIK